MFDLFTIREIFQNIQSAGRCIENVLKIYPPHTKYRHPHPHICCDREKNMEKIEFIHIRNIWVF